LGKFLLVALGFMLGVIAGFVVTWIWALRVLAIFTVGLGGV
jgi:hypothetical protein